MLAVEDDCTEAMKRWDGGARLILAQPVPADDKNWGHLTIQTFCCAISLHQHSTPEIPKRKYKCIQCARYVRTDTAISTVNHQSYPRRARRMVVLLSRSIWGQITTFFLRAMEACGAGSKWGNVPDNPTDKQEPLQCQHYRQIVGSHQSTHSVVNIRPYTNIILK
jgi:hypothetical protein